MKNISFKIGKYITIYSGTSDCYILNPIIEGFELLGQKLHLNKSINNIELKKFYNRPITDYKNYVKNKSIDVFINEYWYHIETDHNTERLLDTMNQTEIL